MQVANATVCRIHLEKILFKWLSSAVKGGVGSLLYLDYEFSTYGIPDNFTELKIYKLTIRNRFLYDSSRATMIH